MKVENYSKYPLQRFRPFIDFCLRRCPLAAMARLKLMDAEEGSSSSGLASSVNKGLVDPAAPSSIEVWLGTKFLFPRYDQHVQELAKIVLFNWEEEVLLVIAHEFRHIHQMWCEPALESVTNSYEAEVDAERFAVDTLKAWRQLNGIRKAA